MRRTGPVPIAVGHVCTATVRIEQIPKIKGPLLAFQSSVQLRKAKRTIMPYTWGKSASMETLPERSGYSQEGPPSYDIERPLRPPPPQAPGIAQFFRCSPETNYMSESEPHYSKLLFCRIDDERLSQELGTTTAESNAMDPAASHANDSVNNQQDSELQNDEQKASPVFEPSSPNSLDDGIFGPGVNLRQKEPSEHRDHAEMLEQILGFR
jgi:hypothetical protein